MFLTHAVPGLASHLGGIGLGFGILFIVIPLFFVGLLFLAGGRARRRWAGNGSGPGHFGGGYLGGGQPGYGLGVASRGAESTLAERFAQGDIDEQEYRARLEVLRANNSTAAPTK